MRRFTAIVAGLLAAAAAAGAARAEPADQAFIRPYLNGAGPSAIFRMGRLAATGQDVIGIVDPVRWRIQYYLLDPWTADGAPLSDRLRPVGDCALAPTFRVWRVHRHARRTVLQSQPEVGASILSPAPLRHRRVALPTTSTALAEVARRSPTPDEGLPSIPCASEGDLAMFTQADAAATTTGGGNRPFVLRRRGRQPTTFLASAVRPAPAGVFTASVQELEDSGEGADQTRHFQVTVRMARPGFVAADLLVVRHSASGQQGQMRIDPGLSRVKMGQRIVAIASTGEVLILGASDRSGFFVTACRFADGRRDAVCRLHARTDAASAPPVATPRQEVTVRPTPGEVWSRALWYASQPYEVDGSAIPAECRGLRPCDLGGGLLWSPLTELRFAHGHARRTGAPYAQSQSDRFRPRWADAERAPALQPAFRSGGPIRVFGDIENGRAAWAPDRVQIVGIDCSALVSYLWGRRTAIGTAAFVALANRGRYGRIESMAEMRMGDALLISLIDAADPDQPLMLNHIALFRETRAAGPTDSSRAILVVESNAACGGVCWSLYDESYFSGWAIIRNSEAAPSPAITDAIPTDIGAWRRMFSQPSASAA